MKITKRTTVPARVAGFRDHEVVLCDFCQKEVADKYGNKKKCVLCERDICYNHTKYDLEEYGDYPDMYCPICYELRFGKYAPKIAEIREKADGKVEYVLKAIREKSLVTPPAPVRREND